MRAILQVADTGPLESLVQMLQTVGYKCFLPGAQLRSLLRRLGCSTVLDIEHLVSSMGYERPLKLPIADVSMMKEKGVVYIDVKAHVNRDKVVKEWPSLRDKIIWYRINGGEPEHVPGKGDEINPGCLILTPNRWYGEEGPWKTYAYSFWPPFYQIGTYSTSRPASGEFTTPICLIHGIEGWGYRDLIPCVRELGVKCYGVRAPDGLVNHTEIPRMLSKSIAMVHLKSNDAPGYALYEALAAGCPVICTRRLIWRCKMQDLLIPGETCLAFDKESHAALSQEDLETCSEEISAHLSALKSPEYNRRIGEAGRKKLHEVMWSPNSSKDVESLRAFLSENIRNE